MPLPSLDDLTRKYAEMGCQFPESWAQLELKIGRPVVVEVIRTKDGKSVHIVHSDVKPVNILPSLGQASLFAPSLPMANPSASPSSEGRSAP